MASAPAAQRVQGSGLPAGHDSTDMCLGHAGMQGYRTLNSVCAEKKCLHNAPFLVIMQAFCLGCCAGMHLCGNNTLGNGSFPTQHLQAMVCEGCGSGYDPPAAQAVAGARLGPWKPWRMLMAPAGELARMRVTKKGLILP